MLRNDLRTEIELWMGEAPLILSPEEVVAQVKKERNDFLADFVSSGATFLAVEQEEELQNWTQSEAALAVEKELSVDLDWVFKIMKKTDLGAHDLRHMLLVSWESLLTIMEMNWEKSWQKWAVLSALSHDWGRVIEGKMRMAVFARGEKEFFWQDNIHAQLSFFVLSRFLENYRNQIPSKLIDLILYTTLEHPGRKGAYDSAGILAQIVQNADRTQMINAEETVRMFPEEVNHFGYSLGMEKNEEAKLKMTIAAEGFNQSWKQRLEFFWRRIHLIIGRDVEMTENNWKKISGHLLWTVCLDWQREQIFYPEILVYEKGEMSLTEYKKGMENEGWKWIVDEEIWQEMKEIKNEEVVKLAIELSREKTPDLIKKAMTAAGMNNTEMETKKMIKSWEKLTEKNVEEGRRFGQMLSETLAFRIHEEKKRKQKIAEWEGKFETGSLLEKTRKLGEFYL